MTSKMSTPWGVAQEVKTVARGVHRVCTAGHGGLMVSAGVARETLSYAAAVHSEAYGNFFCWEEDCAIAIPCFERFEWSTALNFGWTQAEVAEEVKHSASEYLALRARGLAWPSAPKAGAELVTGREIQFTRASLPKGEKLRVVEVKGSNLVAVSLAGQHYKLPVRWCYGERLDARLA